MQPFNSGQSPARTPAHTPASTSSSAPALDVKNSKAIAATPIPPINPRVTALQNIAAPTLTSRQVSLVEIDAGSSASVPNAGDSKLLSSVSSSSLLATMKSIQQRMEHDCHTDFAADDFVERYKLELPLLQAAVNNPDTCNHAIYLLTLFLHGRVNASNVSLDVADKTDSIVNSLFSCINSAVESTAKLVLASLRNFTNFRPESSAISHEVCAFILGRLRHSAPSLAAQFSRPGLYALAAELFTNMSNTSPAHARDVMAAISADPSAQLAIANALINPDDFFYPNSPTGAPMNLLRALIRQLDNFEAVLNLIPIPEAKVAFMHDYCGASNSIFASIPSQITPVFDAVKRLSVTDFPLSVDLALAAVSQNNLPHIQQYVSALSAKKDLTEADKNVFNIFSAAISLADGSSAWLLSTALFTPEQKLIFLASFYQRHELISMDTEDRQYRDLHASNMSEGFKNQARQMILHASPDALDEELERLTQVLKNGWDTAPIFVAARGFLEDKIKAEIPEFFTAQIAEGADEASILAHTLLRQEYFVLYNTFLSNPRADVTLDFIRTELARIETLPLDIKDVLKTMLNRHAIFLESKKSTLGESKF
jgi:hypothetical protein